MEASRTLIPLIYMQGMNDIRNFVYVLIKPLNWHECNSIAITSDAWHHRLLRGRKFTLIINPIIIWLRSNTDIQNGIVYQQDTIWGIKVSDISIMIDQKSIRCDYDQRRPTAWEYRTHPCLTHPHPEPRRRSRPRPGAWRSPAPPNWWRLSRPKSQSRPGRSQVRLSQQPPAQPCLRHLSRPKSVYLRTNSVSPILTMFNAIKAPYIHKIKI